MKKFLDIKNYYSLPKWYEQYERADVVNVELINDGDYVVVTTHVVGDGHDTHKYTIWTYESLGSDSVYLKELVIEWSK